MKTSPNEHGEPESRHRARFLRLGAAVAAQLATGTWTHDYPISADEAREMGLPVRTDMPQEIFELMTLYPQPVRRQGGGVEYLPGPRHREARGASASR